MSDEQDYQDYLEYQEYLKSQGGGQQSQTNWDDASFIKQLNLAQNGSSYGSPEEAISAAYDPNKSPEEQLAARQAYPKLAAPIDRQNSVRAAGLLGTTALEGLGGLGGSALGTLSGPVGTVAGGVGGSELGHQAAEALGMAPQDTAYDSIQRMGFNTLAAGAGTLLPTAARGTRNFFVGKPEGQVLGQELQHEMALPGILGAPRGTSPGEAQAARELAEHTDTIVGLNPMQGLNPEDPRSFGGLIQNVESMKEGIALDRLNTLKKVDGAGFKIALDGSEIDNIVQGKLSQGVFTDQAAVAKAKQEVLKYFSGAESTGPSYAGFSSTQAVTKPKSATEVQAIIKELDTSLKQLNAYDNNALAAALRNPSADPALMSDVMGKRLAREAIQQKLYQTADTVSADIGASLREANKNLSGLIEMGDQLKVIQPQTVSKFSQPVSNSLNTAVQGASPQTLWGSAMKTLRGRSIDQGQRMQNLGREGEIVNKLQLLQQYKTNPGSVPQPMSFAPTPQMMAMLNMSMDAARNYDYSAIPGFGASLPRNTQAVLTTPAQQILQGMFSKLAPHIGPPLAAQEAQNMAMMISDPTFPVEGKRMEIANTIKRYPFVFEATPDGYISPVDGKFTDPFEASQHLTNALDAYGDDPGKRAEVVGKLLSQNKYIPIKGNESQPPPKRALPGVPETPSMTLDDFGNALSMDTDSSGAYSFNPESSESDATSMVAKLRQAQSMREIIY